MRIGVFIGTRPEIVSLSTLINNLPRKLFTLFFFDVTEESGWFEKGLQYLALDYPTPKKIIKWNDHESLKRNISEDIEKHEIDMLLASGYSSTVLASLEASKELDIPSIHLGSGLRNYRRDKAEFFRQVTDVLAPFHLTIMSPHRDNLIREGFPAKQIRLIGSTSTDAVLRNLTNAIKKSSILDELELDENEYYVGYFNKIDSIGILDKLSKLSDDKKTILIASLSKSLKKNLIHNALYYKMMENHDIIFIEVLDFLDYITLSYYSKGIITDSDWMLLELSVFRKPLVYLSKEPDLYGLEFINAIKRVSTEEPGMYEKMSKFLDEKSKVNVIRYLGNGEATEKAIEALEEFSDMSYEYPSQNVYFIENNRINRIPFKRIMDLIR